MSYVIKHLFLRSCFSSEKTLDSWYLFYLEGIQENKNTKSTNTNKIAKTPKIY